MDSNHHLSLSSSYLSLSSVLVYIDDSVDYEAMPRMFANVVRKTRSNDEENAKF